MNKFNIFSGMLKAYEQDERPMIRTTASSSVKDLAKDEILPAAIYAMADRAKNNLTIYLNHERTVPEDVFGSVVEATVVKRGADEMGSPIYDLDLDIAVNDENPRAVQTYNSIRKGTQLGTSIGAIVRHATKKKDGGLRIDELDLMEASIVSIPANPRSWVHYAMKAFNGVVDDESVIEDEDIAKAELSSHARTSLPDSAFACPAERKYPHHTASGAVDKSHLRNALSRCGDSSNDQCGCAHIRAHAKSLGIGGEKSLDELMVFALRDGVTEDHFHSTDVVEGPSFEWDWDHQDDKAVDDITVTEPEPDKEAATVRVEVDGHGTVSVDTSRKPQEAEADPETGLLDETADGDDEAIGDGVTREAPETDDLLLKVSDLETFKAALTTAVGQIEMLTKKLAEAEAERDAAIENFTVAKAIVERIAKLPIGPKATYRKAADDFHKKFAGIYSDEFLQFLEK